MTDIGCLSIKQVHNYDLLNLYWVVLLKNEGCFKFGLLISFHLVCVVSGLITDK